MKADISSPKKLHVNGAELAYIERGAGPLLVLVHGTLGDYRTWRAQLDAFSTKYHVITYSRRYHFPSQWTLADGDYSLEVHARDLSNLIAAFSNEPAHIVCASWGGNVALYLAMHEPKRIRSMVLAEPPTLPLLSNEPSRKFLLERFHAKSLQPAREAMLADRLQEGIRYFIDGVMGSGAFEALPTGVRRYFLENATELKAELLSENYLPNITRGMIAGIDAPVLLLKGDRSPEFFHAIAEILHDSLKSSRLVTVPMSSHGIHADNPSTHNRLVLDFLHSVDSHVPSP